MLHLIFVFVGEESAPLYCFLSSLTMIWNSGTIFAFWDQHKRKTQTRTLLYHAKGDLHVLLNKLEMLSKLLNVAALNLYLHIIY